MNKLEAQRAWLLQELNNMQATLSGCDWCCGGGNERWAKLKAELQDVEKELGILDNIDAWDKQLLARLNEMEEQFRAYKAEQDK